MPDPKAAPGLAPYQRTKVFISYRRDGNAGDAERLYDELKRYFSARHLFLDVKSIGRGDSFPLAIETALASCGALLAVIGPRWLGATDEPGRRRLDDPSDMVRREVSAALAKGAWVIPVLAHGATMPETKDLPDDIRRLAECQAVEIRSGYWERDVRELVALLKRRLYRRKRLATALSFAAALAVVAVLSYYCANVALPVHLTPDGEVKIQSVQYHPGEEDGPVPEGGTGPQELFIEGLADAGRVFMFDGKRVAHVRVDFDSARFHESTVEQLKLNPDWATNWNVVRFSSGGGDPTAKPDYDQACSTSALVAASDSAKLPTSLRFFQQDSPEPEQSRAISLSADRELAVSVDVKTGTQPDRGPGCSKQFVVGDGEPQPALGYSAAWLARADAPFHFQFGAMDKKHTSKRDDLLRFVENDHVDLPLAPLSARRVTVRARGGEVIPCGDKLGRAPTTSFEASSADGKSSLHLQRLEIGTDYFRLVADGEAYVVSNCQSDSASPTERLQHFRLPAFLLLASACVALMGLVYSVARL